MVSCSSTSGGVWWCWATARRIQWLLLPGEFGEQLWGCSLVGGDATSAGEQFGVVGEEGKGTGWGGGIALESVTGRVVADLCQIRQDVSRGVGVCGHPGLCLFVPSETRQHVGWHAGVCGGSAAYGSARILGEVQERAAAGFARCSPTVLCRASGLGGLGLSTVPILSRCSISDRRWVGRGNRLRRGRSWLWHRVGLPGLSASQRSRARGRLDIGLEHFLERLVVRAEPRRCYAHPSVGRLARQRSGCGGSVGGERRKPLSA